jgi:hypothetical protein
MSQFLIGPAPTISGADLAGRTLHDCGAARSPAYRSSSDSSLEGNGFELPVRGSSEAGCRPFSCVSCLGRVGVLRFSSFFHSGKPFDGAWLLRQPGVGSTFSTKTVYFFG